MKGISRFILFTFLRWKLVNSFPNKLDKYIIIVAPHTSWQDFPIAILAKYATIKRINYIGKESLFNGPFGFLFRFLGGTPVDRSKNNNIVDSIIQIFNSKKEFRLALSPEGTRKKVERWKTGFYYIAKGANVPIVMVTLNFKKKEIKISKPYYTTDNKKKDFEVFYSFYKNVQGKNPDFF